MATEAARPSSAELASLEHAFASDPTSDAYKPLAEAYLALGRFMEAMVVCKKGVKAHPTDAEARVLLAQVYADQGKDKKALEELKGAIEVDGDHAGANRLMGVLLLNQGEMDSGGEHLKRAARSAPDDPDVREACTKWGIDVLPVKPAPPPPPEPPPAVAAPPPGTPEVQATSTVPQPRNGHGTQPSEAWAQPATGAPPPPTAAAQPPAVPPPAPTQAPAPPPQAAPMRQAPRPPTPAPYTTGEVEILDERVPPKAGSFKMTLAFMGIGIVALVGYGFWYAGSAERDREISKLLKTAQEQLSKDSYSHYRAASKTIEEILDKDPGQFAAHAYAAYINVLRWGEHGEGDTYKQAAQEHLERARKEGRDHSHLLAAEAYFKYFSGDGQGAIKSLEVVLERPDVASSMLSAALGMMLMWSGELDEAQKRLLAAQTLAPGEPRILAALGELERRRDREVRAYNFYESALNFDKEHVDSLIGKALIALDSERLENSRAEEPVQKVLSLSNEFVSPKQMAMAHFANSLLLYSKNKEKDARTEEERALMIQPNNPDIRVMMGRRWFRLDQYEKAAQEIRQAIKLEPKRAGFYVELARVLLAQRGKAKEAVEALEKARMALPDNPNLLILLGNAHGEAGSKDAALKAYGDAIAMRAKEDKKYPQARLAIARLHRETKDLDRASAELRSTFEEFKAEYSMRGQAEVLVEMALIAMARGNEEEAKKHLESAATTDQTYSDTYFWMGKQMSSNSKAKAEAKQALEIYLKLAPSGSYASEAESIIKRL